MPFFLLSRRSRTASATTTYEFGHQDVPQGAGRLQQRQDRLLRLHGRQRPLRRVNYVADAGGFRAQVDTNEPGTLPGASADAVFNSNPRPAGGGRYSSPYTAGGGFGGQGPWAG
ncbi:hypothetical protein HPB48_017699 [Haemaphysalis longicornis]|uniref:Cuticular protein n=1 Tax=Haemaphysalis longicornis TaxID=44386 RepID=A0A9J6G8V7_HAELO|nr:hypothetical protein HPB48_017699 [Haemaphysalis longicornis]